MILFLSFKVLCLRSLLAFSACVLCLIDSANAQEDHRENLRKTGYFRPDVIQNLIDSKLDKIPDDKATRYYLRSFAKGISESCGEHSFSSDFALNLMKYAPSRYEKKPMDLYVDVFDMYKEAMPQNGAFPTNENATDALRNLTKKASFLDYEGINDGKTFSSFQAGVGCNTRDSNVVRLNLEDIISNKIN